MGILAQNLSPVYFAQYESPTGDLLYGTAQETTSGWAFIDELGTTPFYADIRAIHLHGIVAIANAQQAQDTFAARWEHHLLRKGCRVTAA